jgi:hypothetical protein
MSPLSLPTSSRPAPARRGAKRRLAIATAAIALLGLLLAACSPGAGGPGWSFAPVGPTPETTATPDPESPAPTDGEPIGNVIDLEMTAQMRYTRDGEVIDRLELVVGQEYTFRVDNVAGFIHDIYFGPPDRLSIGDTDGLPGLPEWQTGVQEFTWTPTAEAAGWEFGCTVPGHYQAGMHGQVILVDE